MPANFAVSDLVLRLFAGCTGSRKDGRLLKQPKRCTAQHCEAPCAVPTRGRAAERSFPWRTPDCISSDGKCELRLFYAQTLKLLPSQLKCNTRTYLMLLSRCDLAIVYLACWCSRCGRYCIVMRRLKSRRTSQPVEAIGILYMMPSIPRSTSTPEACNACSPSAQRNASGRVFADAFGRFFYCLVLAELPRPVFRLPLALA
eukprot:1815891-Pleurochrysis_carterae.AAC.1